MEKLLDASYLDLKEIGQSIITPRMYQFIIEQEGSVLSQFLKMG